MGDLGCWSLSELPEREMELDVAAGHKSCWVQQGRADGGDPPALPRGGDTPPFAHPTVGKLLIVPCQIDL